MTELYVRPAPGRRIRVPARNFAVLPDAGDRLPEDTWLRRLIAAGDLVEGELDAPAADPAEVRAEAVPDPASTSAAGSSSGSDSAARSPRRSA